MSVGIHLVEVIVIEIRHVAHGRHHAPGAFTVKFTHPLIDLSDGVVSLTARKIPRHVVAIADEVDENLEPRIRTIRISHRADLVLAID